MLQNAAHGCPTAIVERQRQADAHFRREWLPRPLLGSRNPGVATVMKSKKNVLKHARQSCPSGFGERLIFRFHVEFGDADL